MRKLEDINLVEQFGVYGEKYKELLENVQTTLNENKDLNEKGLDITDAPISPVQFKDNNKAIIFSEKVMEEYKKLSSLLTFPETALEYSFVLLGKSARVANSPCYFIDELVFCNKDAGDMNNRSTNIDQDRLNAIIAYGKKNGYDFISLGHTHPLIDQEEMNDTIAMRLPEDVKKIEYIREPGLNVSLQDVINSNIVGTYLKNVLNIAACSTIIMFNGEVVMFNKNGKNIERFVNIMSEKGESVIVSTKASIRAEYNTRIDN